MHDKPDKEIKPFLVNHMASEGPKFSKHRIYIYKYQNGWFINREPLHYEALGWVAETKEKLHLLLDEIIEQIEKEK